MAWQQTEAFDSHCKTNKSSSCEFSWFISDRLKMLMSTTVSLPAEGHPRELPFHHVNGKKKTSCLCFVSAWCFNILQLKRSCYSLTFDWCCEMQQISDKGSKTPVVLTIFPQWLFYNFSLFLVCLDSFSLGGLVRRIRRLPLNHFVPYFLVPCGAPAGVLQRDLKVK